jgi:hypothetical protein
MSIFKFYLGSGRTMSAVSYLSIAKPDFALALIRTITNENPSVPLFEKGREVDRMCARDIIEARHVFGMRFKKLVAYRHSNLKPRSVVWSAHLFRSSDGRFDSCLECLKAHSSHYMAFAEKKYPSVNGKVLQWLFDCQDWSVYPFDFITEQAVHSLSSELSRPPTPCAFCAGPRFNFSTDWLMK